MSKDVYLQRVFNIEDIKDLLTLEDLAQDQGVEEYQEWELMGEYPYDLP